MWGGVSDLTFPIYLTEGDNGETGRLLYQFVVNSPEFLENESYYFKDNEIVIVDSIYGNYIISRLGMLSSVDWLVAQNSGQNGEILITYLRSDGTVSIMSV